MIFAIMDVLRERLVKIDSQQRIWNPRSIGFATPSKTDKLVVNLYCNASCHLVSIITIHAQQIILVLYFILSKLYLAFFHWSVCLFIHSGIHLYCSLQACKCALLTNK
jgi:hypothetical protein